jgi:tetratricopeptide (TPR) repeat protein
MPELYKIAETAGEPRSNIVLFHGLGGHHFDTWRCGPKKTPWDNDKTFWPLWLVPKQPSLRIYSIGYQAPVSRLRGTAMHLTDQATSILASLLAEPELATGPMTLVGHSLGGLMIKQLLRTADSMSRHNPRAGRLVERVEKVAFLGTPHFGSGLASLGDRLRILVRPSASTASLLRNDPNLKDLNNWYRDWANARNTTHLVLSETQSTSILGIVVPLDSSDPGLAKVRAVGIETNHLGICKPIDEKKQIFVLLQDFIFSPVEQAISLSDEVAEKIIAVLDARGETKRAGEAGVERHTILELARQLRPDETIDFPQAVKEIRAAIDIAIEVSKRGTRDSNLGALVDTVRSRIAQMTKVGDIEGATREADQAFAQWEQEEHERHQGSVRSGIAILEAGLDQDILRRDAVAAAKRVARIVALEHPNDGINRFVALRKRRVAFAERGSDRGTNLDLLISVEIARHELLFANDAAQRGAANDSLGYALRALGRRELGTVRLKEAVGAYRAAAAELDSAGKHLDQTILRTNLGSALRELGERETSPEHLQEAIQIHRAVQSEISREAQPRKWAMSQVELGLSVEGLAIREQDVDGFKRAIDCFRSALTELTRDGPPGERARAQLILAGTLRKLAALERKAALLEEAIAAIRASFAFYSRDVRPQGWATAQASLGAALTDKGYLEDGIASLTEAELAYAEALKEHTRERVPLDWAGDHLGLGKVQLVLGIKESGTASLDKAVEAYKAALSEFTIEQSPLDWAVVMTELSHANILIAERTKDHFKAELALSQINSAIKIFEDAKQARVSFFHRGGSPPYQARLTMLLKKAEVLANLLKSSSQPLIH